MSFEKESNEIDLSNPLTRVRLGLTMMLIVAALALIFPSYQDLIVVVFSGALYTYVMYRFAVILEGMSPDPI